MISQIFQYFIFFIYGVWILNNTLFWVGLWQEKEYRWDRLSNYFRENVNIRKIFINPLNLLKVATIVFYIFTAITNFYINIFYILFYLIYISQFLLILKNILEHKIKRPTFTSKALSISLLTILLILIFISNPLTEEIFWILIIDKITFLIVTFLVFLFSFPTEILEFRILNKARTKILKFKNIKVIAVSGSYGKTSTKDYLSQILSIKYNMVSTPGSNNTPLGIARTILKKINDSTEIFIVEMGAYKLGEIDELCNIVNPQISVTTGISDQHLALYGNIENVINSEYELIKNLPTYALSIFNGNSLYINKLIKKTKNKKIIFATSKEHIYDDLDLVKINKITANKNNTSFEINFNKNKFSFVTNLLGEHVVENLMPGIILALMNNISYREINRKLKKLNNPAHTLNLHKINSKLTIIDDTFNSSPESVYSATNYVSLYKEKKIIVLSPLVELGENSKIRHEEIGEKLGNVFDYIYLTNKNYYKEILKGINKSVNRPFLFVGDYNSIARKIKEINFKAIILFEGKDAGMILKKII